MIVIARQPGYLANSLLLFANVIACGEELGVRVSNPAFAPYADSFSGTRGDPWCRFPSRIGHTSDRARHSAHRWTRRTAGVVARLPGSLPIRTVRIEWGEKLVLESPDFAAMLRRRGITFLQGWEFLAPEWLERHAETVRDYFSLAPPHMDVVDALERSVRTDVDVVVGVHLRQGDYKTFEGGKHYFEIEEYTSLMARLNDMIGGRVRFMVCSNVPQEAAAFGSLDTRPGPGVAVEDLYSLARCDYIVGPKSTFSMWASFFGEVPLLHMERGQPDVSLDDFAVYIPSRDD